ncbi:MAG: hypothetical protein QXP77_00415 [Candidatus Aenigmatarchaeota archaeon]
MIKLEKLKGKDKLETCENISIISIFLGGLILSIGIGSTIFTPKGFTVVLAMLGAFISFVSTLILIIIWLIREIR